MARIIRVVGPNSTASRIGTAIPNCTQVASASRKSFMKLFIESLLTTTQISMLSVPFAFGIFNYAYDTTMSFIYARVSRLVVNARHSYPHFHGGFASGYLGVERNTLQDSSMIWVLHLYLT